MALIRGSATNQDGHRNGLTAPNGLSQQRVIRQALKNADLAPAQISYVEAHGTGTALGDPIEVNALKTVLMQDRTPNHSCAIGSVKTNIGHLEAAAGIAGLIKVVLSLQHQEIPPNLHLQTLNPHISLAGTPLSIPTACQPWPVGTERRFAGVSSFGFGGTNAHVVLAEAPLSQHWSNLYPTKDRSPTYPWQRERCWLEQDSRLVTAKVQMDTRVPLSLTRNTLLAMKPSDRQQPLESYFHAQVAIALGCSVAQLDLQQPLNRLGIDSLMAMQLKHRIETDLEITIRMLEFLQCSNFAELATKVRNQLPVTEALTSNDLEEGEV